MPNYTDWLTTGIVPDELWELMRQWPENPRDRIPRINFSNPTYLEALSQGGGLSERRSEPEPPAVSPYAGQSALDANLAAIIARMQQQQVATPPLRGFGAPLDSFQAFNPGAYLARYPDVAEAVAAGAFPDARAHYNQFGRAEGRQGNDVLPTGAAMYRNPLQAPQFGQAPWASGGGLLGRIR